MTNEVLQKIASDEQNISSSNGLEPSLRFGHFVGNWEKSKLSSLFKKCLEKNKNGLVDNVICNSAKNGLMPQRDFFDKDIANTENTNGYYIIQENDFVYNPRKSNEAPYGPISMYKYKDKGIVSPLYLCFRATKEIHPRYFEMYFKSSVWHKYIYFAGDSGARYDRVSIKDDVFFEMPINIPSLPEQQKIADFLSLVDRRIEKQRQLVENLKKYKRGLLSAIFDNKLIGENWKKYKLSSILKERSTYSEKDGSYEHVTLSRDGIIPKTERYDRDFLVSSENKKYKITKMGDICYNPANMKFGVICLNTYGNAIFSPIYITFEIKSDFDKPFVGLYMTRNDFINRSLKFQQGTVYERMAVSPEDLLSMDIELPNLEAQKRISNIFTILDKKIVRENNIFNELQKMKRALLQQMFI